MHSQAWSFRVPRVSEDLIDVAALSLMLAGIQEHPQVLSTAWTWYRSIQGHWVLEGDIIFDDMVPDSILELFVPGAIWSEHPRPLVHEYIYVKP